MTVRFKALVVVAALAALAGCSAAPGPVPAVRPSTAIPLSTDPATDYSDPADVCRGFAVPLFTAADGRQLVRLVAPYVTAELEAAFADVPQRSVDWRAQRRPASTGVPYGTVMAAGEGPADTLTDAWRAVRVTLGPSGGGNSPRSDLVVFCRLRADRPGQWRVAGYDLAELGRGAE